MSCDTKTLQRDMVFNYLIKENTFVTLTATQELFVYRDGIYLGNGEAEKIIKEYAESILEEDYKVADGNEVIGRIKARTSVPNDFFDNQDKNLIPVENGLLNFSAVRKNYELITRIYNINVVQESDFVDGIFGQELEEFSPSKPFLNKIDVRWTDLEDNSVIDFLGEGGAHGKTPMENFHEHGPKCPNIDKFLHDVLNNEAEVSSLYEFIGYCLYHAKPIQQSFMFQGEGSNGKSTVLELIKRFLGAENCSHISLQDTQNRFTMAELFGKLANFYADLKSNEFADTGNFKMATGGNDTIGAEIKFVQRRLNFVNYAKFAFSCNQIPPNTNDDTKAFWRRWVIFSFVKVFDEEHGNVDRNILDKLTTKEEFEGLLVKAIVGLLRLLEHGKFSNDKGSEFVKTLWTANDSVKLFCDEMLVPSTTGYIPKNKVYEAYLEFCKEQSLSGFEDNSVFGRKLHRYVRCFDVQRTIDFVHGVWCYQGFKLKDKPTKQTEIIVSDGIQQSAFS